MWATKCIRMSEPKHLTKDDCAVYVRHAWKTYKKPYYLFAGLHMTMMKGTIYALLGASGCGKTSLLSCIVGIRSLDSGDIWVLGGRPGSRESGVPGNRVGYMPQELALYGEFSIKETMLYFGWIYGLETKDIKERVTFLVQLLDLPPAKRLVKNLSGGQQRRVSLAVAVMHEPELLILDEPTVGVDPILRANIWNYMVRETKEKNISIIITTHYIEEARQAQTIGLMRNGELLAEDAPAQLLKMFGCATMEDVFLKLSRQQEISRKEQLPARLSERQFKGSDKKEVIGNNAESSEGLVEEKYGCCNKMCYSLKHCMSCVRLRALLFRNLLRLIRNLPVLLFVFALPVIQVVLFCICVGNDPKRLTLAVVNHEAEYKNSTYIYCPYGFSCTNDDGTLGISKWEYMSCGYLKYLEVDTLRLRYYPDTASCKSAVNEGLAWGCMHIKSTFSQALLLRAMAMLQNDLLGSAKFASNTEIQVWLDMSNHQIAHTLKRAITEAFDNFTKDLMEECNIDSRLFKSPMSFEAVYGSNRPSFTAFAAPGVLLTIVFFLAVGLTATALIMERLEGLFNRAYVAGVTPSEILLSHVITQFIIMVGQTVLALTFMIAVFKVDCIGSMVLVVSMTLLQGLCGMCFGFVISAVCSQERNAIQLALGSFYPAMLLSGVIWPIEAMPAGLRYVSLLLPITQATRSLRSVMLRGWGIAWPHVYWGYVATCIWIVIFLVISLLVVKFRKS